MAWPCSRQHDGGYRTDFGPSCPTDAFIYARVDVNLKLAARRLTQVRLPGTHWHETLKSNQERFVQENESWYQELALKYQAHLEDYFGALVEAQLHAGDPHPPRLLASHGRHVVRRYVYRHNMASQGDRKDEG